MPLFDLIFFDFVMFIMEKRGGGLRNPNRAYLRWVKCQNLKGRQLKFQLNQR